MTIQQTRTLATEFREAMASMCSPVAVITATNADAAHGTTVSAVMSLSMAPPMLAIALDRGSDLLGIITRTGRFGVNVLSADQTEVALACARKGPDKFTAVPWRDHHGLPRIQHAAAWAGCTVADVYDGGDHALITGLVSSVDRADTAPLTYHGRGFGTHLPHSRA